MTSDKEPLPMTEKRTRSAYSTASSSSDRTVTSPLPNELLALGDHLVRELEASGDADTLARWIAHHLAETLIRYRSSEGTERDDAATKATDLILKLWAHRATLPGNVRPLKSAERALAILARLEQRANPFAAFSNDHWESLLARAFDGLQLLLGHGVRLAWEHRPNDIAPDETEPFWNDEERRVQEAIHGWLVYLKSRQADEPPVVVVSYKQPSSTEGVPEPERPPTETEDPQLADRQAFAKGIDELMDVLRALKTEVSNLPAQRPPKP